MQTIFLVGGSNIFKECLVYNAKLEKNELIYQKLSLKRFYI